MDVRLEHTDGLARQAEIWLSGRLYCVCDGVSSREQRCEPGLLKDVRLTYVSLEHPGWEAACQLNPSRKRLLEHVRSWSYVGFGEIVQVMPVVIDFGVAKMEDPNWSSDESLVGKYVRVNIERLELVAAASADWPEGVR